MHSEAVADGSGGIAIMKDVVRTGRVTVSPPPGPPRAPSPGLGAASAPANRYELPHTFTGDERDAVSISTAERVVKIAAGQLESAS